jgi:hypothetical protein
MDSSFGGEKENIETKIKLALAALLTARDHWHLSELSYYVGVTAIQLVAVPLITL